MIYSPGAYFTWLKLFYRPQMLWAPTILPRYKRVGQVWVIFVAISILSFLVEQYQSSPDESRLMIMVSAAFAILGIVSYLVFWTGMIALGTRLCSNGSQTVVPGPVAPLFIGNISYSARKVLLIFATVYATCDLIRVGYFALSVRNDDLLSFSILPLAVSVCWFLLVIFGTRLVTDIAGMVFCQRMTAHEMAEAGVEYRGFDYAQETNFPSQSVWASSLAFFGILVCGVFYGGVFMVFLVAVPAYLMMLRLLYGKKLSFAPLVFIVYFFLIIGISALFSFMSFTQYLVGGISGLSECISVLFLIAEFVLNFILGLLACEVASAVCGRPSKR